MSLTEKIAKKFLMTKLSNEIKSVLTRADQKPDGLQILLDCILNYVIGNGWDEHELCPTINKFVMDND